MKTLVLALAIGFLAVAAGLEAQNVVTRESVTTGTVDRIERATRLVTVRGDQNNLLTVYVDPSVRAFDDLQTGDTITVHYVESAVVELRPNAALADPHDTTAEGQKGKAAVVEQLTAVVTIEEIDPQLQSVTYRTASGTKAMRQVNDPRLLKGLHAGDRVRVTVTRERAIKIDRKR